MIIYIKQLNNLNLLLTKNGLVRQYKTAFSIKTIIKDHLGMLGQFSFIEPIRFLAKQTKNDVLNRALGQKFKDSFCC